MSILGSAVIAKASSQLLDKSNIEFSSDELLAWLNDGQRQIAVMAPTATALTSAVRLAAGSRQLLPASGWILLDIYMNMGTNGSTPGRMISVASKRLMDSFDPDWHTAAASNVVSHYVYDLQDQLAYWVYPPSDGTNYIQVNYSSTPADLPNANTVISVPDVYATALLDYILYRAYEKEDEQEEADNRAQAQVYWNSFTTAVTGKSAVEAQTNPNQSLLGRPGSSVGADT
jgi:hypothetical protein